MTMEPLTLFNLMSAMLWIFVSDFVFTQQQNSRNDIGSDDGTGFEAKWNVPSAPCDNYGSPLYPEYYGIETNPGQAFNGSVVVLFFSYGLFPYIEDDGSWINGGVPQNGNLTAHLAAATETINQMIPDPDFSGSAVIDFEDWRPVWDLTAGTQQVYKDASIQLVRQRYPDWSDHNINKLARSEYENAGRAYLYASLELGKKLRPKGLWGFYGYPYVDNYEQGEANVSKQYQQANDELAFIINNSTAIYVSIYTFKDTLTSAERGSQVQGRIYETLRVRKLDTIPIFPYWWFSYHEKIDEFLTQDDIAATIGAVYNSKLNGVIIWGGSSQVNSYDKCNKLGDYLNTELGPYLSTLLQP